MKKILGNTKLIFTILAILCVIIIFTVLFIHINNKQPANFVKKMLDDMKSSNAKTILSYLKTDVMSASKDIDEFTILTEKLDYKIISSKKSGKTGKVVVEISNKDIKATLDNYRTTASIKIQNDITSQLGEEEIEKKLDDYLKEKYEEATTITAKIEINLTKDENGWKVNEDEENVKKVLNAILPEYYS